MSDLVGNPKDRFGVDTAQINAPNMHSAAAIIMLTQICNFNPLEPSFYNRTRIDVYETLCPQLMLVHKGGKIKNWGGECRDVTPTKSLSQNIRVDVNREVKFL